MRYVACYAGTAGIAALLVVVVPFGPGPVAASKVGADDDRPLREDAVRHQAAEDEDQRATTAQPPALGEDQSGPA
jgi:hypothetical protein